MTIKSKLLVSTVAAAALVSNTFAGVLTVPTGTTTTIISSEALSIADVNVTNVLSGAYYIPEAITLTSLKNPIFEYKFSNTAGFNVSANTVVCEVIDKNPLNIVDANMKIVAVFQATTDTSIVLTGDNGVGGDVYVSNQKVYVLRAATALGNGSVGSQTTIAPTVTATYAQQNTCASATPMTAKIILGTGDSQNPEDDSNSLEIANSIQEYGISVSKEFSADIDASDDFATFVFPGNAVSATADDASVTVTKAILANPISAGFDLDSLQGPIALATTITNLNDSTDYITSVDANYTAAGSVADTDAGSFSAGTTSYTLANTPTSPDAGVLNIDGNVIGVFDINAANTGKVLKTEFSVDSGWAGTATDCRAIDTIGTWSVFGYQAQVPNVRASGTTQESYFNITNRSTITADAIFTLIANNNGDGTTGNTCTFTQDTIAPDGILQVTASELIASADAACTGFAADIADNGGKMSVEINVLTAPDSVYTYVNQVNGVTGVGKDLPVYNTSEMTY